jgi:lipoic acid synthetase
VTEPRKLIRIEARNAEVPIEKKPEWIKTRIRTGPEYSSIKKIVSEKKLHTVCQEALCPNIFECWEDREATFLIGGEACTRRCDFCNIDTGKPLPLDRDEPRRVAESVRAMNLKYATITGVARDDLDDEGAWLYAETISQVHQLNPGVGVEMLAPDFSGHSNLLNQVFETRPEVFAHNLETVPRIFKEIRPAFRYERSLDVITQARDFGLITKSNLILGMGETREEVTQALVDLRQAGCDLITITQYLRPTAKHHPVIRWVKPNEFVELSKEAEEIGFLGVMSGPLVRSSYRAGRLYNQAMAARAVK